jgi:uncharacterized integral membrane protein
VYRIAFILVTVLAVALGLLVGTLNSAPVMLDLLWLQLEWPLGLVVLAACTAGLGLGLLLAALFSILPLKARLRKAAAGGGGYPTAGSLRKVGNHLGHTPGS